MLGRLISCLLYNSANKQKQETISFFTNFFKGKCSTSADNAFEVKVLNIALYVTVIYTCTAPVVVGTIFLGGWELFNTT